VIVALQDNIRPSVIKCFFLYSALELRAKSFKPNHSITVFFIIVCNCLSSNLCGVVDFLLGCCTDICRNLSICSLARYGRKSQMHRLPCIVSCSSITLISEMLEIALKLSATNRNQNFVILKMVSFRFTKASCHEQFYLLVESTGFILVR
jgi:hypothetical protein